MSDEDNFNPQDLMTKEDQELLHGIDCDGDEAVVLNGDDESVDINSSEITDFLLKLGFNKFRQLPGSSVSDSAEVNDVMGKGKQNKRKENPKHKEAQVTAFENGKNRAMVSSPKVQSLQSNEKVTLSSDADSHQKKEKKKKKKQKIKQNQDSDDHNSKETNDDNAEVVSKSEKSSASFTDYFSFMKPRKLRKFLLLKPEEMWRDEEIRPLPDKPHDDKVVAEAEQLSKKLLEDEIELYTKQRQNTNRSEAQWMKTVLASGTLSDKMAALTLLVQESPVHNMASIDNLIAMAGKKGRREASMAIDTLKDLFLTGLLPDDRKLRVLPQRPLLDVAELSGHNVDKRDKLLLKWYFEHLLKEKYSQFIKILSEMTFDTLPATKEKAISIIQALLSQKPEQEHILLPILVNKLGDSNIKSKASFLLSKLAKEHPQMNAVIVREIKRLLYRPNVSTRAQYYAICYLTQLHLNQKQRDLASELIQLYFSFFQTCLKKKEVDSKMLSALLTGVNRAYVYASEKKEKILSQMDDLYKLISTVNFNTGVQALMLLFHVTSDSSSVADRFYMCLYRKLADPDLRNSSKQAIFLNLLFRSLKRDIVDRRIQAFIKRVLQVYAHHPPQAICGVLLLLSEILSSKPTLLKVNHQEEVTWGEGEDEEDEKFVDLPVPEEFQLDKDEDKRSDAELDEETNSSVKGSWNHRFNKQTPSSHKTYDPTSRNPLFNRAESECVWELEELVKHYHPTVSLYASKLLKGEKIDYDGNPLNDFTLIRFLDKFVFKNPKKSGNTGGEGSSGKKSFSVNSKAFLKQKENNVPENERFFYKYFREKAKMAEKKEEEDSDVESVADEDFEEYLDQVEQNMDKEDGFDDMDLNFASDKAKFKDVQGEGQSDSEDDDGEEDDDDFDVGDTDLAKEFEKELQELEGGMDDSELEDMEGGEEEPDFSPDENDELQMMMAEDLKPSKKGKKRKNNDDLSSLFASADQFAEALEEDAEMGDMSVGSAHQFRNTDRAGTKQLMWEEKRDKWMRTKGEGSRKKRKVFKSKTKTKEQRGLTTKRRRTK